MARHKWGPGHELPGWTVVRPHERQACMNCGVVRVPSPSRSTDYYPAGGGDRLTKAPACIIKEERA